MKNKYMKVILPLTAIIIMLSATFSYAEFNEVKLVGEESDIYKKWQALSDEEKENTMQPASHSLKIEDSLRKSLLNKIENVGEGETQLPTEYGLTNFNLKNQMATNICWAFSTTTAIETNLAKTRNKNLVLSASHIDYATSRNFADGVNKNGYNRSLGFGKFPIAFGYATSGNGPVLEEDMPFNNSTKPINLSEINKDVALKINDYKYFADVYKVYNNGNVRYTDGVYNSANEYTENEVEGIRNRIKEHIMNYGAVTAYTYLDVSEEFTNTDGEVVAYFNNDNSKNANHAVTIVGWNDNFSKDNFKSDRKPSKDGAYLVVNTSYGTDEKLRLLAVSYEDIWIEYQNYGVISTSDIDYDNLYQYDEYGCNASLNLMDNETGRPSGVVYTANVFTNNKKDDKDEILKEVSIYVPSTTNVDIYVNPESDDKTIIQKVASAGILDPGYYTIKLSTPLKLTGDKFVVASKLTSDEVDYAIEINLRSNNQSSELNPDEWDYATSNVGESFVSIDGQEWTDMTDLKLGEKNLKDSNVCLKAFTTYQDKPQSVEVESISLDKTNIELKVKESATLVASIRPSNADNKNVIWESSNSEVAIVSNGIVTAVSEGEATITVKTVDGNKTAICKVTVSGQIPQEDEVYYQPDTNNSNSSGGTTNNTKDTTTAVGTIPQTGINIIQIVTIIFVLISVTAVIVIKVRKYKDIK